jgi:phosphatidylglycerophosphatase C
VSATRRLAIFDLDGTISRHDTFMPFLLGFLLRHPWRLPRLLLALPAVLGFPLGVVGRGPLKAALIRAGFGDLSRSQISDWAERYVPRVIATGLFAQALAAIDAHRRDGDALVLMSASPDLYVPLLGRRLGFDRTVCTEITWNGERLEGRLATPNRRGEEKTRCLEKLRADYPALDVIAYGNSESDLDHLRRCDEGVYVNGGPALRRNPLAQGLRHVDWA